MIQKIYFVVLCIYLHGQTSVLSYNGWISHHHLNQNQFHAISSSRTGSSFLSRKAAPPLYSTTLKQQQQDEEKQISPPENNDDDDDDEWEYQEYEILQESDFYNSEWKIGTLWDNNPSNIDTTWCRLVLKDDQNVAIWGDGAVGKWNFDVASQFLGISKDSFGGWLGKKIWAGVVDDYYYIQGTVRGWSPISPASVLAQWQAKRLGVSEEEAGTAPWFQDTTNEDEAKGNIEESR